MQQLTLHVSAGADAAYLSDILLELGAYSATVTDRYAGTSDEQKLTHAVIEEESGNGSYISRNVMIEDESEKGGPPIWTNAAIIAYFGEDVALENLVLSLLADFDLQAVDQNQQGAHFQEQHPRQSRPYCLEGSDDLVTVVETSKVKDEILSTNWVAHVQQTFKAITIGGLLVRAPWHAPSEESSEETCELILEPGQAFGTGEHPTTQLIANWLQAYAQKADKEQTSWSVLDYGCGSGILAIAAALLGAETCVGCDIDPLAVETAASNAIANNCESVARFGTNHFEAAVFRDEKASYSVVVANILAVTLKELATLLVSRVPAGGSLVLSGILCEQAAGVSEVFLANGFRLDEATTQGGWTMLAGTKPS